MSESPQKTATPGMVRRVRAALASASEKTGEFRSSRKGLGATDLAKVDAHVITPEEYEEIPELTDEMMARAVPGDGRELLAVKRTRRDQAASSNPEESRSEGS